MTTVTHLTETQRFRQDWLWALLLVGTVPGFCLAAVAIVVDSSGPWTTHLPLLALAALLVLGPLPLFWWAGLRTEVRDDGLSLRLWPLQWSFRHVPCEDVLAVESADVSAFRQFGGVGIRWNVSLSRDGLVRVGPKGYVVDSGPGVRIERRDARDLIVTSSDAEALAAALERACSTSDPIS